MELCRHRVVLLIFPSGVFASGNEKVYAMSLGVCTFVRCFYTYAYASELQPVMRTVLILAVVIVVTCGEGLG